MSGLTAVKVRGKRNRKPEEKWHHGKKRKTVKQDSSTSLKQDANSQSSIVGSTRPARKRKRHDPELSQLEQLPTEILQLIFTYSANVELPLASPRLASQLANAHLFREISDRVFDPIIKTKISKESEHLAAVTRLMNSRFFTWTYFQDWLEHRIKIDAALLKHVSVRKDDTIYEMFPVCRYQDAWEYFAQNVEGGLLPPLKVFKTPFTKENLDFLRVCWLAHCLLDDFDPGPLYMAKVKVALRNAIAERNLSMVVLCVQGFKKALTLDISYIRTAVVEGGCVADIIETLAAKMLSYGTPDDHVDWLDPDLWAWATKASQEGDKRGRWLMQLLRQFSELAHDMDIHKDDERYCSDVAVKSDTILSTARELLK